MKLKTNRILIMVLAIILIIPCKVLAEGNCIDSFGSINITELGGDNNVGGNVNYFDTKNNNHWSTDTVTFNVKMQAPSGDKVTKIKYKIKSYDNCTGTIEGNSISSNTGSVTLSVVIDKGYVESMSFWGVTASRSNPSKLDSINSEKISIKKEGVAGDGSNGNVLEDLTPTSTTCDQKKDLINFILSYWKYIVILAPILLIVMGTVDFLKALASSDADIMKKSTSNFMKRTIATILVLILPGLLRVVFGLLGLSSIFCF